jgi:hypothetical protein
MEKKVSGWYKYWYTVRIGLTIPDSIGFVSGRACHIHVAVISMHHLVAKILGVVFLMFAS